MVDRSKKRKRPRILIVEDREDDILLLKRRLDRLGRLEVVRDGSTALSRCGEEEFDLVMIDVRLPDIDGTELLLLLRESHPRCAVIVMTAYGSEEVARKVMQLGA